MLWMGDGNGKCLYLNRTLREFWGVALGGRRRLRLELFPASRRQGDALRPFAQAMRDHTTLHRRSPLPSLRRRIPPCCARTPSPRFGPLGDFLGMIGVNVDITETRRAEQALKESEERFRLIANSAPVPMWVSRLDGKRAFVNQAYMDFLGLGYDECLVFDWRKALHPDDLRAHPAASRSPAKAPGKPFALEARYRRGDGQWRWLRSELQPRWGPDGEHIGFIGVAHDITSAKQGRDRAARAERDSGGRRSRRARASATASGTCRRTSWSSPTNRACGSMSIPRPRRCSGWSQAELLGRTAEWLAHPDDIVRTRAETGTSCRGRRHAEIREPAAPQGRFLSLAVMDSGAL